MSCGNPYKHMIKNAFTPFIDAISSEKKLTVSYTHLTLPTIQPV